MYMGSLNCDILFKKVFSDLTIAKAFLEDVFDVKIQDIKTLPLSHKVTNEASVIEFDFRCKIDDYYVIIDMQQWYKSDIIHRFYTYHTMSTVLQLENLPLKTLAVDPKTNKEIEVKDYRRIEPVITLVWLVDDVLNTTTDFLSYSMTQEITMDFINNEDLWRRKDIHELLKKRDTLIHSLSNNTKHLDFIPKNKLIFAFQKNIIKNPKHQKYFNWFSFAELSKNKENKEEDFKKFANDKIFKKPYLSMKKRIGEDVLTEKEKDYLIDDNERLLRIQRNIDAIVDEYAPGLERTQKELKNKNTIINNKDKELKNKDKELEKQRKLIADLMAKSK